MAPGSSGPLSSSTGAFTSGEIPLPFTEPWDWNDYTPGIVVFRSPKVSQKAVNDAKKAQERLWYETVAPTKGAAPHSGGKWEIQWRLSYASKTGGYIVQHIRINVPGHGKQGARTYDYWEAWKVPAGSRFTTLHGHLAYDDEFKGPAGTTFYARARFYAGLNLPSTFTRYNPATKAHYLRSTTINPQFPTVNATDVNKRWWEAH